MCIFAVRIHQKQFEFSTSRTHMGSRTWRAETQLCRRQPTLLQFSKCSNEEHHKHRSQANCQNLTRGSLQPVFDKLHSEGRNNEAFVGREKLKSQSKAQPKLECCFLSPSTVLPLSQTGSRAPFCTVWVVLSTKVAGLGGLKSFTTRAITRT